jgi:hypothetical protein
MPSFYETFLILFVILLDDVTFDVHLTGCESRVAQLEWNCSSSDRYVIEYQTSFEETLNHSSTSHEDWRVAKVTSSYPVASARQNHHRRSGRGTCVERLAVAPGANYVFSVTPIDVSTAQSGIDEQIHRVSSRLTSNLCRTPADVPHLNPRGVCTYNTRPGTLHIVWQVTQSS